MFSRPNKDIESTLSSSKAKKDPHAKAAKPQNPSLLYHQHQQQPQQNNSVINSPPELPPRKRSSIKIQEGRDWANDLVALRNGL
jgi:hypothetical protein